MKCIKAFLTIGILTAPAFTFAANTIVFKGEVTDQTCAVSVDGSANPTVLLDSAPASNFNGVGAVSTPTPFTISLSGCPTDAQVQNFTTTFVANSATSSGNMTNTANGGATGVALQLLDKVGGAQVNLSAGATDAGLISLQPGATSTSYQYEVQYIAEAATVTPGAVESAVTYAIRYE